MLRDLFSLFPAYAGVILFVFSEIGDVIAFPRIRGGDPSDAIDRACKLLFSPHTRG